MRAIVAPLVGLSVTACMAHRIFTILAFLVAIGSAPVLAQPPDYLVTNGNPSGAGSLAEAIAAANASSANSFVIQINSGLTIQPGSQLVIAPNTAAQLNNQIVTILGGHSIVDMSQANEGSGDRAFFVAGGTVIFSDLTIQNGLAQGGDGASGGGGGAGLGGAIFVANLAGLANTGMTQAANVTLNNVSFQQNQAIGGTGGIVGLGAAGGGGGMGGNGGLSSSDGVLDYGGGGGGGFGFGANGGSAGNGQNGAATFSPSEAGADSSRTYTGGLYGGGGAGAPPSTDGGGGGIGGLNAENNDGAGGGGIGGFGGGGGGGFFDSSQGGGIGGFGGGGGAGPADGLDDDGSIGGAGGFGGGGGYGFREDGGGGGGEGGFGAGTASSDAEIGQMGGGGGLGAGGALFVMDGASLTITTGSFTNNISQGGVGFTNGSQYGGDLFLGADVTFAIPEGETVSINNLGGGGNTADPNVTSLNAMQTGGSNVDGGIIKTGAGNLVINGTNYYSGSTIVHEGTLTLGPSSSEAGTSSVVIGQNDGDNGTLVLATGAALSGQGTLLLGQDAGANGSLVFSGSSLATLTGFSTITNGSGNGTVVFAPDEGATFTFDTSAITGGTTLTQNGPGTTIIQPPTNAVGTYAGSTFVMQGTLQIGTAGAIQFLSPVFVQGGVLDLYEFDLSLRELFVTGGTVLSSASSQGMYPLLELDFLSTTNGTIGVSLNCGSDFQLTQDGPGTTVLTANNLVQGSLINILQGELLIEQEAQLRNAASIEISGNGSLTVNGSSSSGTDGVLSGAQSIVVGKNDGDTASLNIFGQLLSSGNLSIGESAGSTGTITVTDNVRRFELQSINGGSGGGELIFAEAAPNTQTEESLTVNAQITGNLSLIINTSNTIFLQPLNGEYAGENTYTGNTVINSGTLATAVLGSIASDNQVIVNSAGTLQLGGTQTLASLSGDGTVQLGSFSLTTGNLSSVFGGVISGSGNLVKSGSGIFTLSGNNTYTGSTLINSGQLLVNGSISSDITLSTGASLGGSGNVGNIGGAGSIGPGNSPGILTANSVDPSQGISFQFEFTSLNPIYSEAAASGNDVLRISGSTPFLSNLTLSNTIDIYFNTANFGAGQTYTGGFFTDTAEDFYAVIQNASFNYYIQDNQGAFSYNGVNYSLINSNFTVEISTVAQTANFLNGTVNGQVLQLQIIPEANSFLLISIALIFFTLPQAKRYTKSRFPV